MLPNGSTFPITGRLTSTDSAERRQIESDPNARVVLVGERGGVGAAIAGAGSGKSANNVFTALGAMLSEGRDVNLPAGTPLAVQLDNAVTLRGGGRLRGSEASTIYTAAERFARRSRRLPGSITTAARSMAASTTTRVTRSSSFRSIAG